MVTLTVLTVLTLFPELVMRLERVHKCGWLCKTQNTPNYAMN